MELLCLLLVSLRQLGSFIMAAALATSVIVYNYGVYVQVGGGLYTRHESIYYHYYPLVACCAAMANSF